MNVSKDRKAIKKIRLPSENMKREEVVVALVEEEKTYQQVSIGSVERFEVTSEGKQSTFENDVDQLLVKEALEKEKVIVPKREQQLCIHLK